MITAIAMGGFVLAAVAAGGRLLLGPHLADRVAALDVVLLSLMGAIVVDAAGSGDTVNLALLIVIAIIGFTATVSVSRFIERGEDLS